MRPLSQLQARPSRAKRGFFQVGESSQIPAPGGLLGVHLAVSTLTHAAKGLDDAQKVSASAFLLLFLKLLLEQDPPGQRRHMIMSHVSLLANPHSQVVCLMDQHRQISKAPEKT